jgi:uncharacterized spore protein YtfJ
MDDNTNLVPTVFEVESASEALDIIEYTMENFLDTGNVEMVYGEPVMHGDTLIIPCSEALTVMGIGTGYGYGSGPEQKVQGVGESEGGGGGGGGFGRSFARPVAVIVASPEGVRVEPVLDLTKLALGALTAFGFMVGMMGRMRSPRRSLSE